uniref:Uncharacterized protein n=1 Tax=Arundo donax TaxID=35708 RepID=A0A0A8Z5M7_ARUDO
MCGSIVKDKVPINIKDWQLVDKEEPGLKDRLWTQIQEHFEFPDGSLDMVCRHALMTMSMSWRYWKYELNNKYVKKRLEPFNEYGKLQPAVWDDFVKQKLSKEGKKSSEDHKKAQEKNKHPHRLGSDGYERQIQGWRRKEEEDARAGRSDPLDGLDDRGKN